MVIIEHRRHSIRSHTGHLTQQGVHLARSVSQAMPDRFDYVVTSPLPRALQTAVAFGYGIDEARDEIQEFNHSFRPLPPWDGGFPLLFDYFQANVKAREFLRHFFLDIIRENPDAQSFLFVSHSGIVESSLLSCLQEEEIRGWGENLSYCEGVRWKWDGDNFMDPEVLRAF